MHRLLIALMSLLITSSLPAFAEETAENAFAMTTNAFLNQGMLPVLYTCDGKNVSPLLEWSNTPAKTQSFALVMTDLDKTNGIFYHWVLFNIPSTVSKLEQGITKLPAGALLAKNSFDKTQYDGPCPPHNTAHTYSITLFALDAKLSLKEGAEAKEVVEAIDKHTLEKTELTTVYSRWFN